ncbi:metal-dependent hydrolase [Cellvibrio polysaccharolyticus]|uniref:Metal-dependent hydrolase n=1 Tax=Cellvibrio polysaccharolyticus TaxID=2082724 RepID=A0A928V553_9GAMM|nr:metal-dependent hydrolase [Cellvibrio polysaccharolyticus]MBE8718960.1 metal-dependent hydrolase [Cellvibrio polysaccharolyticus]
MDLVTHSLLGATVAVALAEPRYCRRAALAGALIALVPDVDIFMGDASDPLQLLEWHRHFTHSLLLAPVVAALAALISYWLRWSLTPVRVFSIVLAVYASACLLDWCTSYGTHLLWPLIKEPLALSIIAVVDPLFTLVLATGLIIALRKAAISPARMTLCIAVAYLLLGGVQHLRAMQQANQLALERYLSLTAVEVKPTMGNLLLWRSIMVDQHQNIYADAIRLGFSARIYSGEQKTLLDETQLRQQLQNQNFLNNEAIEMVLRYQKDYAPWLVVHSGDPLMIGDARFAMLPDSLEPLWGLEIHPDSVVFVSRRKQDATMRQHFLTMLAGKPVEQ